jgi:hypothetical protein
MLSIVDKSHEVLLMYILMPGIRSEVETFFFCARSLRSNGRKRPNTKQDSASSKHFCGLQTFYSYDPLSKISIMGLVVSCLAICNDRCKQIVFDDPSDRHILSLIGSRMNLSHEQDAEQGF